ncbi:MAG: glycine zipper domain-containing protein [Pirellulaceae bacterium]|nr:glycine zipper domain-containing protein [Pirellulaceae bacterium]
MQWNAVFVAILTTMLVWLQLGCKSPHYADQGAGIGAVTGALAGAAIGEHNGNAGAGALLGGALGALTGAAVGDVIDEEIARNNEVIEARLGRQLAGATSMEDVIAMTEAGVPEPVIVSHIKANGVVQRPDAGDVITLHQQGVSEAVINSMQKGDSAAARASYAPQERVIVEEHHWGSPFPRSYHYHRPYHRYYRPAGRSRLHLGLSWP